MNTESEVRESAWLVYLVVRNYYSTSSPFANYTYFHIPGQGRSNVIFDVSHTFANWLTNPKLWIDVYARGGTSQSYDGVEVVRIKATDNIQMKKNSGSVLPSDLDVSDYDAVAEYYGF